MPQPRRDEPSALSTMSDAALLKRQAALVAERRRIDAALVGVAGEIARRSTREAGFAGLAQQHGHRSARDFIATTTGLSRREAGSLVRLAEPGSASPAISAALEVGAVSVAAADAIVRGLGGTSDTVDADALDAASASLLAAADEASPEELTATARDLRAALDADSVLDRERELRRRRSLRLVRQEDGLTRLIALLDPESAALVRSVLDAITAPRRGGPRFVAAGEVERTARLERDPRTTEQLALDGFIELLRIGAETAPETLVGATRPAVRIHVTDADLRLRRLDPRTGQPIRADRDETPGRLDSDGAPDRPGSDGAPDRPGTTSAHANATTTAGFARFEGEPVPVSIATAERHICATGTVPIHFDSAGQVINVGREHRLYTRRQRIGMAARDGGCRWPGCDRPPSWCEAHHIDEWDAHGGRTDLSDGVLLCRFHHLMVHDRGWRIRRGTGSEAARYWAERDARRRAGPGADSDWERTVDPEAGPAVGRERERVPLAAHPPVRVAS